MLDTVACNIVANCRCSVLIKILNPPQRICRRSQLGTRLDCNQKVAVSSPLCATIFLPTMFASWHTSFTGEDLQSQ